MTRSFTLIATLAPTLLLGACLGGGDKSDDGSDGGGFSGFDETDADTDTDTDTDSDADADADTDADTDTDTDTDTTLPQTDADHDGSSSDDDCDDHDPNVYPGADELCNGEDDDCDHEIDEDAVDAIEGYIDADGDGFGDPATYDLHCEAVDNGLDCDDTDATEPQVVDGTHSGSSNGTLSKPWTSIQDGIDASDLCVVVYPDVYSENVDFDGQDILVQSVEGPSKTMIDGGGAGPTVTFSSGEGSGAELVGFAITGGQGYEESTSTSYSCGGSSTSTCTDYFTSWCGGGIYVDGARPTLHELLISDNHIEVPADSSTSTEFYYYYGFGGGLCVRNATLTMEGVDFMNNSAEDGGAVFLESTASLSMSKSFMIGNVAENGGAVEVDGGSFTLTNAVLGFDVATAAGGGIYAIDATLKLTNVTIGESEAGADGGGIYASGTTSATVMNTIVYGANSGVGVLADSTASYTGSYNNVYGNSGGEYSGASSSGTGNISKDPKFTSVSDDGDNSNDDWSLSSSSPSVNAGNTASSYKDADGTTNDQGAFGGPGSTWN